MRSQQRRAFWIFVLAGCLAGISIGCNPQSLSMLLMPFSDNNVQPEYKLFADSKELKVVILSNFSIPEFDADNMPAENELSDHVAEYLRKRCKENKHKIKIVPLVEVRNFQQKEANVGEALALEAGRKFKADFVVDLDIKSFKLSPRKTFPKVFQGATAIVVNVYKTDEKDDAHRVYSKEFRCEYPSSGPIEAGNSNASTFRGLFLTKVSRDLTKLMIAFPPDERMNID